MSTVTTTTNNQLTTKSLFAKDDVKARFQEILGKRSTQFMTSVLQIVNSNDLLKNADPITVYNAALLAATLDLPVNNNLGMAFIVPYNSKQKDGSFKVEAQFQMGYRSFIQLAQRSGQFKTISATAIYEGQIVSQNPLTGYEFNFENKTSDKVIGYAAYFELLNGFQKTIYKSVEDIEKHAKRFSQTYRKGLGIWKDDFHSMALKTVLKEILSKYAPLSVEMQKAVVTDQAVINDSETLDVTYKEVTPEQEQENALNAIIDGLEFYQGEDKEAIRKECQERYINREFTIEFAEKIAAKIGVNLG
jgi:recombination protein RecT